LVAPAKGESRRWISSHYFAWIWPARRGERPQLAIYPSNFIGGNDIRELLRLQVRIVGIGKFLLGRRLGCELRTGGRLLRME
jgi:hypothetical protein